MLTEELTLDDTATDVTPDSGAVMSEDTCADPADATAEPLFCAPMLDRIRTSD